MPSKLKSGAPRQFQIDTFVKSRIFFRLRGTGTMPVPDRVGTEDDLRERLRDDPLHVETTPETHHLEEAPDRRQEIFPRAERARPRQRCRPFQLETIVCGE